MTNRAYMLILMVSALPTLVACSNTPSSQNQCLMATTTPNAPFNPATVSPDCASAAKAVSGLAPMTQGQAAAEAATGNQTNLNVSTLAGGLTVGPNGLIQNINGTGTPIATPLTTNSIAGLTPTSGSSTVVLPPGSTSAITGFAEAAATRTPASSSAAAEAAVTSGNGSGNAVQ